MNSLDFLVRVNHKVALMCMIYKVFSYIEYRKWN